MKARILLVGKNGQVGHDLAQQLPAVAQVVAVDRQQMDLSSPEIVRRTIRDVRPALIINAAAYTAVDQAEKDPPAAHAINADAPALLATEAKQIGAALIHYSTDYVFDGTASSPYSETDPTNPINVYGLTKLAGEQAIRDSGVAHLIFRTAWVYSTRGKNFLLTILRLATQREELRIVQDQIGAPTSSREIAEATAEIVSQLAAAAGGSIQESLARFTGTYHITAGGTTNWHEFAESILKAAAGTIKEKKLSPWFRAALNDGSLITKRVIPITTADYPTAARRPAYSVLSNALLEKTFRVQLPEWREQLSRTFLIDPDPGR